VQRFAFHRKAQRLRDQALMWRIIVTLDSLGIAGVGLLIIKPYNYVTITAAALWMVLLWWVAGLPLRRYHTLTETTLTLVGGYTSSFTILRDQIDSAERFIAPLPQGVAPVGIRYIPREDTLYILPDKKNLVCVTLSSPATGKVPPRIVEFTRVVCMVDEPDAFIAAVAPGTRPAQGDRPQPVTTKKQEAGPSAINDTRGDDTVIELCNLTKQFGDFTAVNALSLRVARGEIFGFLGSNGAGKSTTMKMLVGLLRPTSGQILILGKDPWNDLTARQQVGYVPDSPMLYENLTAQEHLWLVGGLYDLPEKEARSRALDLLGQLGLTRFADQQIRSY
jgi:ABC-2 type transport system ATP-binding protein